ncbi:MAG: PIG-L family deacetylase [Patescibacteria group bacterium]|nr:PIG-L family deacetylase [Patescibacteria group bacterium]
MERKVVLAIGAHPDDMDFGASGTVARFAEEGAKVYYLIATDGSKGSSDSSMTAERLIKMRQDEQKEAGKILGLAGVFFLDHPDTELVADHMLKEELVRYIRMLKPDTVITMNPTFFYFAGSEPGFVNHTDHRAVGLAVMDSVFPMARDRLTFPQHEAQGLTPWKVKELLFVNFITPEYTVDISNTFHKKVEALKKHVSQFDDFDEILKRITARAENFGKDKGYKHAENFTRIILQ